MNEYELKEVVKQAGGPHQLRHFDFLIGIGHYKELNKFGAFQRFISFKLPELKWNLLFYPNQHHMQERIAIEPPDILLVGTYWGHHSYTDVPYYISDFLKPLMDKRKAEGSLKPFILLLSPSESYGEIYMVGVHHDTNLAGDIYDYMMEPINLISKIEELYWNFLQEHIPTTG